MNKIELKAYAKINIGLDVVRRREDGYHEVKMIMQNVDLYDRLSFCKNKSGIISIICDSSDIPIDRGNLVYRAVNLLFDEYGISDGIDIKLEKNIPIAAGMAGGSADCAAALIAVDKLFELNIQLDKLCAYGKKLGADVPYCIVGGTQLSEGIGEKLTKLNMPPQAYVLIVKPNIAVSTKFVYENLHVDRITHHPDIDKVIEDIDNKDIKAVAEDMENILETVTIREYPIIDDIKNIMKNNGALGALMSGSGPTVFGLFDNQDMAMRAEKILKDTDNIAICKITSFCNGNQMD